MIKTIDENELCEIPEWLKYMEELEKRYNFPVKDFNTDGIDETPEWMNILENMIKKYKSESL